MDQAINCDAANQRIATAFLLQAKRALGRERLAALLPAPFKFYQISDHDTGCQIEIDLAADGVKALVAWRGSVWYSSIYEFNDRDKVLGLNPECEFARAALDRFFLAVKDALMDRATAKVVTEVGEKIRADEERAQAIEHYRRLLEGE